MPDDAATTVTVSMNSALTPAEAFETLVEELATALDRLGLRFEPGSTGSVSQGAFEVGRVVEWAPGERMRLQWRSGDWRPDALSELDVRVEPVDSGSRISLAQRGWGALIGDPAELIGWFAGDVAAPLLRATAPAALGDWLTDRSARRPTGALSRGFYRDPLYHWPNFRVFLEELKLSPDDDLLEVGCGGGALLHALLASGCRAAAIDHSRDMAHVASEVNADAIAEGRLSIQQGDAAHLPFAENRFTHAIMTGVLGHLPDAVAALREIHRTLAPGSQFIALGSDPELRGTPAAPEPHASHIQFYDDAGLRALANAAGFRDVRVEHRDLEQHARESGVPEEHLDLFRGPGARFLFARKQG